MDAFSRNILDSGGCIRRCFKWKLNMGKADRRSFGRFLLSALCTAQLAATGAAAEHGIATAETSPVAMLVNHPEVRKLRVFHWKPFIPAKPDVALPMNHRPEFGFFPELWEVSNLPEISVDSFKQADAVPEEIQCVSASTRNETLPHISRQPDTRISLKDEMITPDDLDIGKYGGMVVTVTGGEREMRGFVRIPTVWGTQLRVPDYLKRSASSLVEGVNRYSEVRAEASSHLYLSSERIFRMPFLFITTDKAFELTQIERRNFAEYLKKGGFAFIDNGTPQYENSAAEASLRQMVKDALGSSAHFEPLPVSHPLYHCWFDFADGPPQGAETDSMQATDTTGMCGYPARSRTMQTPVFSLEGIFLDGRLVGVYSDKGYSNKWTKFSGNTPQLKMGVNLVVYALTREGGMNQRNMEAFSDIE